MTQQLRSLKQIKESIKKRNLDDEFKSMIYETIQKCVNLEIKKKIKFDKDDDLTENQRSFIILSIGSKGKYKVTNEGFVDVVGDFDCSGEGIKDFMGIKFGKISGNFCCSNNKLTSLEGAPQEVGGYFDCSDNQLTSLVGAPQKVGGGFCCSDNQLTSLVGAPQKVGSSFDCSNNKLTSLVGAPQKVGDNFYCYYNNKLTSLEGAPQEVGGSFDFYSPIESPLEKSLKIIYEKMKSGMPYGVALLTSKSKISKAHWDKLDKSSIEEIDPEEYDNIEKGASILSRIGIF